MKARTCIAILGALLLLGAPSGRALSGAPDRQQVRASLATNLHHLLDNNELRLEGDARGYLEGLIDHGLEELASDSFADSKVRLAHRNLEKLVDGLGSHKSLSLEELRNRLEKICPIYPFCKKRT